MRQPVERFVYDFMPVIERHVARQGVQVFGLRYDHPALHVLAERPIIPRTAPLRLRYDPRDLRMIYLCDPLAETYLSIPCMAKGFPTEHPLSLHTLRQRANQAKERGVRMPLRAPVLDA